MTNRNLENKISAAVDSMVPADAYGKISGKIASSSTERTRTVMTKRISIRKYVSVAVAACLVLALGIFGFSYYSGNIAVDSVIDIDVNPSIEITANKNDRVLEVTAINSDGAEILDGMDLKNSDIKVAVNAVIGSMVKKGYFTEIDNGILVTVQNKDAEKADRIKATVLSGINEELSKNSVAAPVINQSVSENDEAEKFAEENGISYGKAAFILSLIEKDGSLVAAELAKLDIYEIAKLINDKNIDIKDIVDYEYDESIFENISDQIEDTNEDRYDDDRDDDKVSSESSSAVITSDKAKELALAHAGINESDVDFITVELDEDDGVKVYEVDFLVGNVEYDYELRASDGAILESEKDIGD